jgi:hypothetical protein
MSFVRASLLATVTVLPLFACGNASIASSTGSGAGTTGTSTSTKSTGGGNTGAGGTGGGSTGGAATGGAGTGGQPAPGQPITAPSEQWTWVDFPDAFCANGKTTGIGVNPSDKSTRALVYLEGGGACWSDLTCYTLKTAANFSAGYGASNLATETKSASYLAEPGGFFDRSAAANPFKDYSYVYVPYCTGDIHAGNSVQQFTSGTVHFVGFANMTVYLRRIVPTFPTADRVILAGSSAGGFGAAYNWWQVQQAFGQVRVDLVDDSGTPMPPDVEAMGYGEGVFRMPWNLAATLPPGCTGCDSHLDALFPYYSQKFPDHRAALLSYVQDTTLPTYFGVTEAEFSMGLQEEISQNLDPSPAFKYFTNAGMGHVLWFNPTLTTGTVTVQQFVTQMVTDDPAWASVHP